jgi:hyperosmotically inducible protein
MTQNLTKLMVLALVVIFVTGCSSGNRKMGQQRTDSSITGAVKEQLARDQAATLTDVAVVTRDGIVSLTGDVPTMEDKARAGRLAREVNGVRNVENNIRPTSMSMAPTTEPGRAEATRTGMTHPHPLWAAADNPTCVLVPTVPVELRVFDDYTTPGGVRPRTDMQRAAVGETARPTDETHVAHERINNDPALAAAVKQRLVQERIADPRDLQVEADRERVYLDGTVETLEQKRQAGEIAQRETGASIVENHLRVGTASEDIRQTDMQPAAVGETARRTDETHVARERINSDPALAAAVKQRLVDERIADPRDLQVEADRERVYLDGTVETPEQKRQAGEIAQRETGASVVENHLRVGTGTDGIRRVDDRGEVVAEPIWAGKLASGKRQEIRSHHGLVRYDYRTSANERFHGDVGAWCNRGHTVVVP